MDRDWWTTYGDEVNETFRGERYSLNTVPRRYNVTKMPTGFKAYGNSGAGAINLAMQGDADTIILLGYDCQHTGGMKHWHGDHPRHLGNALSVGRWHENFQALSKQSTARIINASRSTALECFERMSLRDALNAC